MIHLKAMFAAIGISLAAATFSTAAAGPDNVVLVHGMNMDGSAWRAVYDRLHAEGYNISVVQLPMTSIQDDIAATRRAIKAQDGPVILVGHSYGGMVISQAGTEPAVKALVYVAAFLPEVGESLAYLNASVPAQLPQDAIKVADDGFYRVDPDAWITNVANGLSSADARFTATFQSPVNTAIFGYKAEAAAWRDVPAWAAIAMQDRTIAPQLQRKMAERAGAKIVEIEAGHLVQMSHPEEVSTLIKRAAGAAK